MNLITPFGKSIAGGGGGGTSGTSGTSGSSGAAGLAGTSGSSGTSGAGIPVGLDKQVLFNDGGSAFGADAGLTFDKSTGLLTATNLDVTEFISISGSDNQILFNDAGVIGGSDILRFDSATGELTLSSISDTEFIFSNNGVIEGTNLLTTPEYTSDYSLGERYLRAYKLVDIGRNGTTVDGWNYNSAFASITSINVPKTSFHNNGPSVRGTYNNVNIEESSSSFISQVTGNYSYARNQKDVATSYAANYVLSNTNTLDGKTVTVNGVVYTFRNTISVDGDVQVGASTSASMQNLLDAINYTGTPGVQYIKSVANPDVEALNLYSTTSPARTWLHLQARVAGLGGKSLTLATSGTGLTKGNSTFYFYFIVEIAGAAGYAEDWGDYPLAYLIGGNFQANRINYVADPSQSATQVVGILASATTDATMNDTIPTSFVIGGQFQVNCMGGHVTDLIGVDVYSAGVFNDGMTFYGKADNVYGIRIYSYGAAYGTPTIINNYGLYIADGSATTVSGVNYNFFSAGAASQNMFEGDVIIGGDLDVSTGFISISGADNQILFNDAGVIGGDSTFTYDQATGALTVSGIGFSSQLNYDFTGIGAPAPVYRPVIILYATGFTPTGVNLPIGTSFFMGNAFNSNDFFNGIWSSILSTVSGINLDRSFVPAGIAPIGGYFQSQASVYARLWSEYGSSTAFTGYLIDDSQALTQSASDYDIIGVDLTWEGAYHGTGTGNRSFEFYGYKLNFPNYGSGLGSLIVAGDNAVDIYNAYGMYLNLQINPVIAGTGSITVGNLYGIYIEDTSTTTVSGAAYNIYSAGAASQNKFEGDVEIGGDLDVSTGFISISGSNSQVLFNDAGVIGGDAGLTYNASANVLSTNEGNYYSSRNITTYPGGNIVYPGLSAYQTLSDTVNHTGNPSWRGLTFNWSAALGTKQQTNRVYGLYASITDSTLGETSRILREGYGGYTTMNALGSLHGILTGYYSTITSGNTYTGNIAYPIQGVQSVLTVGAPTSAATRAGAYGFYSVIIGNGGAVDNLVGFDTKITINNDGGLTFCNPTNVYGLYVESPTITGYPIITNMYGVYIGDQTSNLVTTNNYNLYSAGAASQNYFEGDVTIGGDLSVATGTIAISGSDNQVLFNDAGIIGGISSFTYDSTTKLLALALSESTSGTNPNVLSITASRTGGGGQDHGGVSDDMYGIKITSSATTPDTTQYGIYLTMSATDQGVPGGSEVNSITLFRGAATLTNCSGSEVNGGLFYCDVKDNSDTDAAVRAVQGAATFKAEGDSCLGDGVYGGFFTASAYASDSLTATMGSTFNALVCSLGLYSYPRLTASGGVVTMVSPAAICSSIDIYADTGTITATSLCGVLVKVPTVSDTASTITIGSLYGIYIEDQSGITQATAKYNFYSAGAAAQNYIAGLLTIAGGTLNLNKTSNDAVGFVTTHTKSRGGAGQANDEIGVISFASYNDNVTPQLIEYANLTAKIDDPADNEEYGIITYSALVSGSGYEGNLPMVYTKTDAGDPPEAFEGMMVINTNDNTFKVYAEGAWRQLATW